MADEVNSVITTEAAPAAPIVEKHETSMSRMAKRYADGGDGTTRVTTPTNPAAPKNDSFDYSFFKDLDDDDYKGIDGLLTEKKIKDDSLRHKLAEQRNDMKKFQRLVSAREQEINTLKTQNPDDRIKKYEAFFEDVRKDPVGAFGKYKDEFNLPDSSFVSKVARDGGDLTSRLSDWQEKSLVPSIEKKHKIEEGTFVYDPAEAHKPGTPSYEYRVSTEKQEKEFSSEFENASKAEKESLQKALTERNTQLEQLKKDYFAPSSDKEEDAAKANEEFASLISSLDSMWEAMKKGDFSAKSNPFAIYNIFRGVHFDSLVAKRETKIANEIHSQYQKHGMYLPSKEMPGDVTQIKGNSAIVNKDDPRYKTSPMRRSMSRYL